MNRIILMITIFFISITIKADTTGLRPTSAKVLLPAHYIQEKATYSQTDLDCMVANLYHEARGEGFAGMYAVAMVVLNRVEDKRYPDTICGVVQQGPVDANGLPKRYRCQFSWWCDGKSDEMHDIDSFFKALGVAEMVLISLSSSGKKYVLPDVTEGATHYHTNEVSPKWRNDNGMTKITEVGSHIFYRWG